MEIDQSKIRRSALIFFFFFIAMILYHLWMRQMTWPLTAADIINLEIARTVDMAKLLLNDLSNYHPSKFGLLSTLIYLDFGYIVIYAGLIISASRFLGRLSGNDLIERASRFFFVYCNCCRNSGCYRKLSSASNPVWILF